MLLKATNVQMTIGILQFPQLLKLLLTGRLHYKRELIPGKPLYHTSHRIVADALDCIQGNHKSKFAGLQLFCFLIGCVRNPGFKDVDELFESQITEFKFD